jgi:hypothetical protein
MFTNIHINTNKHTHISEVAATKISSAYSASAYQTGRYGERYGELEVHYIEPMIVSEEDEYRTTWQEVWTPLELVVENEEAKKAKAKVQRSAPVKQEQVPKKEKQKVQRSGSSTLFSSKHFRIHTLSSSYCGVADGFLIYWNMYALTMTIQMRSPRTQS